MWMIKITVFIIPLIPLYVSTSMTFPFITGKNFAFRILVEFAAVLWIGLIAAKKEYRIHNSPIVLSVLAFTFFAGLADLFGVDPIRSFWSNFERMEGYVTILHLALYFMILKSVFKTRDDWKIFFTVILLVSICVSLFPLIFTFNKETLAFERLTVVYGTRVFSTIGNPPFLASYLLMSSFIGLLLFFHTQRKYLRLGCLAAVILNCTVIYLTATRGVILAVAAGAVILTLMNVFRSLNKSKLMIKQTVMLILIISIIASGIFVIFANPETVKHDKTLSRFASMLSSESVKDRIDVWEKAWHGIKERPVLGWGQENFIGIYSAAPIAFKEEQLWMDRAHNIVIEWLTNAGVPGLVSYIAIFGAAFYVLGKALRKNVLSGNEAVMIITALLSYFIQNLFTFDTINTYMIYFALLAYIDNLSIIGDPACKGPEMTVDSKKLKIISVRATLAALLCFSVVFYYINFKPIKQARQIIRISFFSSKDDSFSSYLSDFKNTLSISMMGDFDLRKMMLSVSKQIISNRYFNQEGAVQFIESTVEELRQGIPVRIYDLEYLTDVIGLFNRASVHEKSFIALSEALIEQSMLVNPEYEWLNIAMAEAKIQSKDYESAFKYVNRIAGPDPGNENKQFKLALAAIYSSRLEVVNQALENMRRTRISRDKNISKRKSFLALSEHYKLARVYRDVKRYGAAIQHMKELINSLSLEKMYFDQDSGYYQSKKRKQSRMAKIYIEMAEIYLQMQDKENALKYVEKAEKIRPDLSNKTRDLIDSINN